jgi:hypothetical protein
LASPTEPTSPSSKIEIWPATSIATWSLLLRSKTLTVLKVASLLVGLVGQKTLLDLDVIGRGA